MNMIERETDMKDQGERLVCNCYCSIFVIFWINPSIEDRKCYGFISIQNTFKLIAVFLLYWIEVTRVSFQKCNFVS
jgi:hypothetical protein